MFAAENCGLYYLPPPNEQIIVSAACVCLSVFLDVECFDMDAVFDMIPPDNISDESNRS